MAFILFTMLSLCGTVSYFFRVFCLSFLMVVVPYVFLCFACGTPMVYPMTCCRKWSTTIRDLFRYMLKQYEKKCLFGQVLDL